MIAGDYFVRPQDVRFDYIGRLVSSYKASSLMSHKRGYWDLVLETFSPPEDIPADSKPSLNLVEALCKYITSQQQNKLIKGKTNFLLPKKVNISE